MTQPELPIALQRLLEAAGRLDKAVIETPRPNLEQKLDTPDEIRVQLTVALDWFETIDKYYGDPVRGDRAPLPQVGPWRHPESVLGYFCERWRGGEVLPIEFCNAADLIGMVPQELLHSGAYRLRAYQFGDELSYRDLLKGRPYSKADWSEIREQARVLIPSTEQKANRLIQWVRDRIRDYASKDLPLVELIEPLKRRRARVRVRVHVWGARSDVDLQGKQATFLKALAARGRAKLYRATFRDLLKRIPSLEPYISIESTKGDENKSTYLLKDPMRQRVRVVEAMA